MAYDFKAVESKWHNVWQETKAYQVSEDESKQKYYVLDMFPYPSGAGLHVGHPLGYIASDIYSRYKRQKGFNVLHPMGFDAFGLPAEQYAIQTGRHPEDTTTENLETYKRQLNNIGLSYYKLDEFKKAEKFYLRGLETEPRYINILNNLGNLKRDLNLTEEAIEYYKKTIEINDKLVEPLFNLSLNYESLGKFEEAKECLKKIFKLNPKFTDADRVYSSIIKYTKKDDDDDIIVPR